MPMQYLDIAIGFAAIMFALSSMMIFIADLDFTGSRKRGFAVFIEKFFGDVTHLTDIRVAKAHLAEVSMDFHNAITDLRAMLIYNGGGHNAKFPGLNYTVSREEMMTTLRGSSLNTLIQRHLPDVEEELFADYQLAFIRHDAASTRNFKKRKEIETTITAVIVALLLNLSAFELLSNLIDAQSIDVDALGKDVELLQQQLADAAQSTSTDSNNYFALLQSQADLLTAAKQQEKFNLLDQYSKFPYCRGQEDVCKNKDGGILFWLVGCIVTGFLAGIGAPFWHDIFRQLVAFRKTQAVPPAADLPTAIVSPDGPVSKGSQAAAQRDILDRLSEEIRIPSGKGAFVFRSPRFLDADSLIFIAATSENPDPVFTQGELLGELYAAVAERLKNKSTAINDVIVDPRSEPDIKSYLQPQ